MSEVLLSDFDRHAASDRVAPNTLEFIGRRQWWQAGLVEAKPEQATRFGRVRQLGGTDESVDVEAWSKAISR
jgi:hypothetical protein